MQKPSLNNSFFIKDSLVEAKSIIDFVVSDQEFINSIDQLISIFVNCFQSGKKITSCGNGGSMSDAIHFAEELTGKYNLNRNPLPAIAISDPGHITCVANDYGFDNIFSRYIEALGNEGDVLLAISTSGNSQNIINATLKAQEKGMKVIGLLGKDGGKLLTLVDYPLLVPNSHTNRIQEFHTKLIHIFIEGIERIIFPQNY